MMHARRRAEEQDIAEEEPRRRHTDKLLTLDRALLVGIFAVGGWVATADLRQADLKTRIEQLEQRVVAVAQGDATRSQEVAVIKNDMQHLRVAVDKIDENLTKLADSIVRMVNRLRDSDGVRP